MAIRQMEDLDRRTLRRLVDQVGLQAVLVVIATIVGNDVEDLQLADKLKSVLFKVAKKIARRG